MICYGVTTVIGAACLGYMSKHIKRFPIMSAGKGLMFYIISFRVQIATYWPMTNPETSCSLRGHLPHNENGNIQLW